MLQSGLLDIRERVMVVPNCPWLKNGTIRENILLGGSYSQTTYDRVVRACGLTVSRNIS